MEFIFWTSFFLVFYCYFGYPAAIAFLAWVGERKVAKADLTPTVSIVISVWNEADVIGAKLHNLQALDYPNDKIEILIGSDFSTDRTNVIVRSFLDPRIRFFEYLRRGKPATLNDLLKEAKNEIVIFTDARQFLAPDAVRELVRNFADPKIGCVSGELIFSKPEGSTGKGVDLYWTYEKFIRDQESQVHSMLGATGAIYAIRRSLYSPVPAGMVLDDMYTPFKIIQQGYRAIFDGRAKAYDKVADNPVEEYRRKVRTISGNYQIFSVLPDMFNPFRSPVAIQLFSHKFLRVVVPFLLILIFLASLALVGKGIYRMFFIMQIIFYGMAAIEIWTKDKTSGMIKSVSRVCYVPYVFCLLNFSALTGFWRFLTAKQEITWEKARG